MKSHFRIKKTFPKNQHSTKNKPILHPHTANMKKKPKTIHKSISSNKTKEKKSSNPLKNPFDHSML